MSGDGAPSRRNDGPHADAVADADELLATPDNTRRKAELLSADKRAEAPSRHRNALGPRCLDTSLKRDSEVVALLQVGADDAAHAIEIAASMELPILTGAWSEVERVRALCPAARGDAVRIRGTPTSDVGRKDHPRFTRAAFRTRAALRTRAIAKLAAARDERETNQKQRASHCILCTPRHAIPSRAPLARRLSHDRDLLSLTSANGDGTRPSPSPARASSRQTRLPGFRPPAGAP
jgi:hypothetical protein